MPRILYTCPPDSPPGRAVEMTLKYLNLPYEIKCVDFDNGEQFSENYLKMYPQGEIPVLDDNGFIIGESVAIIQYLADKYAKDDTFYPKDVEKRAIVNQRMAFHLSTYYRRVHDYMILPMDYAYERTEENFKKLNHAVGIFDRFLSITSSKGLYVTGDTMTIADLSLIMGTVPLVAIDFDFEKFPNVLKWFENFQNNQPELWSAANEALVGLRHFNKNPRKMDHLKHPIHPTS